MKRKVLPQTVLTSIAIFIVWIISSTVVSQTQSRQNQTDRIENYKIAFMTKRMDLSIAESRSFWPLYNEHEKKIKDLEKNLTIMRGLTPKELSLMSDKEVEDAMTRFIDYGQQKQELQRKFYEDLKKILPIKKVALFYMAERDFKKELVKMAIERRKQRSR